MACDPTRVAQRYDAVADSYDQAYADRRSAKARRFAIVDQPQLAVARGCERVLEIGCGTGRLLAQVRAPVRVGIDVSRRSVARACDRALLGAVADAHRLPFGDRVFDAVLAGNGVFRYLNVAKALAECHRVLRVGGHVAMHQYARRVWTLQRPPDQPLHLDSPEDLHAPADLAGFAVTGVWRWRSVRIPPYAVRIPSWVRGRWWNHCVVTFRKPR